MNNVLPSSEDFGIRKRILDLESSLLQVRYLLIQPSTSEADREKWRGVLRDGETELERLKDCSK